MAKRTLRVTSPTGREFTRQTDRDYSHVVIGTRTGKNPSWGEPEGTESAIGWCGRLELAQKLRASEERRGFFQGCIVVEVR